MFSWYKSSLTYNMPMNQFITAIVAVRFTGKKREKSVVLIAALRPRAGVENPSLFETSRKISRLKI